VAAYAGRGAPMQRVAQLTVGRKRGVRYVQFMPGKTCAVDVRQRRVSECQARREWVRERKQAGRQW